MLSSFSVKRPYTVVVAVVLVAILGFVSLTGMNLELLPNINLPFTVIITPYGGASPEQVEYTVTQPMEQSMATLTNISSIDSISQENLSIVILEFQETANMDTALIEIRENLDMLSTMLPDEVGSSTVMRLNPDMMPIMVASVSVADQSIADASSYIESDILPELESLEGVASVNASGLAEYQIEVLLRDDWIEDVNEEIQEAIMEQMMTEQGMQEGVPEGGIPDGEMPGESADDAPENGEESEDIMPGENGGIMITKEMVSGILTGQNFGMPSGYVIEEDVDYLVRVGDAFGSVEELENTIILPSVMEGIDPVRLKDIAEVTLLDTTEDSFAMVNGENAIIIDLQKQTDYSTAAVADRIRDRMDELMEEDEDLAIIPLMDQGEYVNQVISSISMNLIIGGILAILILILFLKDLKPSITIAFAIPISLVAAFVMMYFSGVTLNIISMGGLALGVGMLVDNSIVVIENIYRMRDEGANAWKASVEGAKQVAGAITASTLTTISVFLPIVFTEGLARQIFTDMGLTIAYSLLASLLVSLTLVPMISSRIMHKGKRRDYKLMEKVKSGYGTMLTVSLKRRWIVVLFAIVFLGGSVYGAFSLGTEFIPPMNTGEISIDVELPEGLSFEEERERSREIMEIIQDFDEIETVGGFIGSNVFGMMGGGGSSENLSIYALLHEEDIPRTQEVAQRIRELAEDLDVEMTVNDGNMDLAMLTGGAISVNIYGRDLDDLQMVARDVAEIVSDVEGTIDVTDGQETPAPEFRVIVDKDEVISHGLTVAQIYMEVSEFLEGVSASTTLTVGVNDYDIYVYDEDSITPPSFGELEDLKIETENGEEIPLTDLAVIEEAEGFSSIRRTGQERFVSVSAGLADGYNVGLVSSEIEDRLEEYELPEGFRIEMGGEIELIMDSFGDLFLMMALGIAFIYLIMVAQFQSLLSPFIVMFTIPLAFTGGFLALIVTGNPVSIIAFVGLIILAGIVVNNGIVFVDYINKLRQRGMEKREAIVLAGKTRLRPIVMTALTTIIALFTLTIGVGQGVEIIQPMAITAVGGLIYATVLTLFLIPVLYDLLNRKEYRRLREVTDNDTI